MLSIYWYSLICAFFNIYIYFYHVLRLIFHRPAQEVLVLSHRRVEKDQTRPVHTHSLAKAFTSCINKVWISRKTQTKSICDKYKIPCPGLLMIHKIDIVLVTKSTVQRSEYITKACFCCRQTRLLSSASHLHMFLGSICCTQFNPVQTAP